MKGSAEVAEARINSKNAPIKSQRTQTGAEVNYKEDYLDDLTVHISGSEVSPAVDATLFLTRLQIVPILCRNTLYDISGGYLQLAAVFTVLGSS